MKKIVILGVALAFGLSACTLFGPVPEPFDAYPYQIQAKVEDGQGAVLCDLMYPEYQGWPSATDALDYGLTGEVLKVPFGKEASAKVFIETTLPNWFIWEFFSIGDFIVKGTLNGTALAGNYLTDYTIPLTDGLTYTMVEKANELFKVMWKDPCMTLIDWRNATPPTPEVYYAFLFPEFSEYVTIERIDPYFAGDATFTVKGADQWHHGNVWTAFRVEFGTAQSAADLILAEVALSTTVVPSSGAYLLPVAGGTPNTVYNALTANGVTGVTFTWTVAGTSSTGVAISGGNVNWPSSDSSVILTLKVDATFGGETKSATKTFAKLF